MGDVHCSLQAKGKEAFTVGSIPPTGGQASSPRGGGAWNATSERSPRWAIPAEHIPESGVSGMESGFQFIGRESAKINQRRLHVRS